MVASDFTNEILRSFDGRTFVIGAYLSKALSPIVFCCLKLEHNSVRGSSLAWFTSYLTNRKHYIYIYYKDSYSVNTFSPGRTSRFNIRPIHFCIHECHG